MTIVGLLTVLGTMYDFMETGDKKTSIGKVDTVRHKNQAPVTEEPEPVMVRSGSPSKHRSHATTNGDVFVDPVTMIELPEIVIKEVPENGSLIIESAGKTQQVHANKPSTSTQTKRKDRKQKQGIIEITKFSNSQ